MDAVAAHVEGLGAELADRLRSLRHGNGAPLARVYGPRDAVDRGGAVAFNVIDRRGAVVPFRLVEQRADVARVHVRGGCFCNPVAAEAALGFEGERLARTEAGALRASLGLANTRGDVDHLVDVLLSFA